MKIIISESQFRDLINEGFDDYKMSAPRGKSINKIHKSLNASSGGKFGGMTVNDRRAMRTKLELSKKEEELAKKKEDAEALFASMPEGMYHLDPKTYKIRKLTKAEIKAYNRKKAEEFLNSHTIPVTDEGKMEYFTKYIQIFYGYKGHKEGEPDETKYIYRIKDYQDLLKNVKYDMTRALRWFIATENTRK